MDRARWEREQDLFHRARSLPPEQWADFLRAECGDDKSLREGVQALLDADSDDGSPLDQGLEETARRLLREPDGPTLPEERFGPYRVREVLGEGGMGVVYLAEREDLGSRAAIKVLRDAWLSPARRDRFSAEQRTLAQLTHPSIARLYDANSLSDGTPWFAMEYVEGVPLTDYCRAHETTIEGRLELFRRVCEAVQHAHAQAVIHRDLKPSNILVTEDGTVKLLDFGIAKHLESLDATADQTRTGLRLMTPAYAAPEQIRGERVGIHSDVYSLGVILYELLTGSLPFRLSNLTPAEAISLLATREPERPSAVARRVGGTSGGAPRGLVQGTASWTDLDVLCLTAMHKDPARRYPTVEALIRDLDRTLSGDPLLARPDTVGYRIGKFVRRNRAAVVAGASVTAVVLGLVGFYTVRLARARDQAVAEAARTQRIQRFMLSLFEGEDADVAPPEDLRVTTLIDRGVREATSLDAEPAVQAELYRTLGGISQKLGSLDRADELLRAALERRREWFGSDHPNTAESEIALGLLRADQASYDEAERLVRDGLAKLRRTLPAGHPSLVEAMTALGHVLVERGAYAEATEMLEEALRIESRLDGGGPDLTSVLYPLANAHFYQGHYAEAEELTRRALATNRARYGPGHPHVADDLVNLGAIRHEQGEYPDAERHYREALDVMRGWYGGSHHRTASVLIMLGRSLVFQDRHAEAKGLLEEALAIQERVFGLDHPRVASAINELGSIALHQGRFDDAEAAYRRMEVIYRNAHPNGHYLVGIALSNLASVSMARAEYGVALPLFRQAIGIYSETLSPEHPNVGIARIKLGRCLLRLGRFLEAERESRSGYELLSRQASPSVSWLRSAREDLAAIYEALGDAEKAAMMRQASELLDDPS